MMKLFVVVSFFLVNSLLVHVAVGAADTYDVYLLAGQSNMDGRGQANDLAPDQRLPFDGVIIYYRNPPHSSGAWKPLATGFSIPPKYKGDLPSPTFGPEIGFATAMTKANPNRSVALIKGSKGGTSLRMDWRPGERGKPETQGGCYRDFIETIRIATDELTSAGHRFEIRGLLWHQGESDSKSSAEVHHRRLLELMDRIRDEVGLEDLPVVVGEVFDNGKRNSVRAALRTVGTSGPRFGLVSSDGTTTWDDGTHFDASSQILLGTRYAKAMLRMGSLSQR